MMDDKHMEDLPEEQKANPGQLTFREKFALGALMVVSGLWVLLLEKLCGWALYWIRSF